MFDKGAEKTGRQKSVSSQARIDVLVNPLDHLFRLNVSFERRDREVRSLVIGD